MAEVAQQAHHLFGGLVVGVGVQGQERRVGAFACRGAQWHPGVHTELSRRVRRTGDDLAGFARVAVTADDDGQSGEVGVAPHLDGCLELVEVDVQDPASAHRPQSLRAKASHASPRLFSVWPPSVSWWCT